MWFGRPFYFGQSITVGARNQDAAANWYQTIFGVRRFKHSEHNEIWLGYGDERDNPSPEIAVVPIISEDDWKNLPEHPIIFTKNITKARAWFSERIPGTGSIQADSGGNSFFTFRDPEGNQIEVCREPR